MRKINSIPINHQDYKAYGREDSLILFHSKRQDTLALDAFSAWLFLSIDNGMTLKEIEKEIDNDEDKVSIAKNYNAIYSLYNLNLRSTLSYIQEYSIPINTQKVISRTQNENIISTNIGQRLIKITSKDTEIFSECYKLFKTLPNVKSKNYDFIFEIKAIDKKNIELYCNSILLYRINNTNQLAPILIDHLQNIIYQSSDYLIAFHSATLVKNQKALLLPGSSGSGKTILSLSLAEDGFQCLSDEISVISKTADELLCIPLPASIKQEGWNILKSFSNELSSSSTWYRTDGRILKYVKIPQHTYNDPKEILSYTIIFPKYDKKCKNIVINKLDNASTLKKLTDAGYQIKDSLSQDKFEKILEWTDNSQSFQIIYSSLTEAHKFIKEIM